MPRLFTPAEANRTLPLVKRIVADILEKGHNLHEMGKDKEAGERSRRSLERELRELLQELERIGCFYKDWGFEMGLVDFPAKIGEEDVFLCWRSDEEEVKWYHSVQEGFAARRQIPDDLLN